MVTDKLRALLCLCVHGRWYCSAYRSSGNSAISRSLWTILGMEEMGERRHAGLTAGGCPQGIEGGACLGVCSMDRWID